MNSHKTFNLFLSLLIFTSGCSIHRPFISGAIEQKKVNDTLEINYSFHIKDKEIDSVAFQLLPPGDKYEIYFPADNYIKDSLYQSLGDSLECCQYICPQLLKLLDKQVENDTNFCLQCWWSYESSIFWNLISSNPESIFKIQNYFRDKSLKVSIPCSWDNPTVDSIIDTILQADSLLYISEVLTTQTSNERLSQRNISSITLSGKLKYFYTDTILPTTYVIKLYDDENESRTIYEMGSYLPEILAKYFHRPKIARHDFEESGSCLGMLGGIGSSKINKSCLNSHDPNDFAYYLSLDLGFTYYTPRMKYAISGSINGTSPKDKDKDANSIDILNVPGVRIYPFNLNESKGLSLISGISYRDDYYKENELKIEKKSWGLQLGVGFENYFDRLDYIYHLHKDAFHQIDLLIGTVGIKQGKAGIKSSIYFDDDIKSVTFQLYMENRLLYETMDAHNPRPLWLQSLLYLGMFAGWYAIN